MRVAQIDHFTLRVDQDMLPVLLDFYSRVLQLRAGARPAFSFPGYWLYAGDQALVHLVGNAPGGEPATTDLLLTGKFDHVSLRTHGLKSTREHLPAQGIDWQAAPAAGSGVGPIGAREGVLMPYVEWSGDGPECAKKSNAAPMLVSRHRSSVGLRWPSKRIAALHRLPIQLGMGCAMRLALRSDGCAQPTTSDP